MGAKPAHDAKLPQAVAVPTTDEEQANRAVEQDIIPDKMDFKQPKPKRDKKKNEK